MHSYKWIAETLKHWRYIREYFNVSPPRKLLPHLRRTRIDGLRSGLAYYYQSDRLTLIKAEAREEQSAMKNRL